MEEQEQLSLFGGVSFVVPVHSGAATVRDALNAIAVDIANDPSAEIIVVDDFSHDDSRNILAQLAENLPIRIVPGRGRGAAAALNAGIRAARFPLIAHVDQDVIIHRGWTRAVTAAFADPALAAVQGWFVRDRSAALCTRAASIDLEQRYDALANGDTDHVSTGHTMYRAAVLHWVGLFDESLGHGYDNDVSYRIQEAGYRLRVEKNARSEHRRREDLTGLLRRQYRVGYGRIDVVHKHPWRLNGDCVSPAVMMSHPLVLAAALVMLVASGALAVFGLSWQPYFAFALTLVGLLFLERVSAAGRALSRFGDVASLTFPVLHLARDLMWVAAITVWTKRWIAGRPTLHSHHVGVPARSR
jgi:cellulose synthase/poly-beta-1,6-N-acetylglucosamine synthase-like glycosyltransferase